MGRLAEAWGALTRKAPPKPQAADFTSGMMAKVAPYWTPPPRGAREALHGHGTMPWLRAIGHRVGTDVSLAPGKLYRKPKSKKGKRVELLEHPFLDLIAKPNPRMGGEEALYHTQIGLDFPGECFWVIERNAFGQPVEAWPVPSHWVMQTPMAGMPWFRFSYLRLQGTLPEADVVWFREPNPEDPYGRGLGTALALGDELDTDENAAKRTARYFYNNASPEVMVSAKGMNKDQAKAAKEEWEQNHRGFWNAFRSMWTGSDITVTRLDTSFKDMQLVDLRKFERDTIIQVFGVPPEILGIIENSNRSTIDAAYYHYAKMVLAPRLARIEKIYNSVLLPQFSDEGLVWEFVNPIPEDRDFTLKTMQAFPQDFMRNEKRKVAGLDSVEGGDEFPAAPVLPLPAGALAADPEWARGLTPRRLKAPPAADGALEEAKIPNILEQLRAERLIDELQPVMQAQAESWAQDQLDGLGVSDKFDILNPLIPKYLDELSTEDIKGLVNGTTRDRLRDTLTEGVRAGESISDLMDRVEDVFTEADEVRAETIARTETLKASNWATHEAQKASGVVDKRAWVATRDGRTRPTHAELDGTEVGIDEPFEVDGEEAMYPGGFGDPAEDINCRCTTVAVIDDPIGDGEEAAHVRVKAITSDVLAAAWKAYDAALGPWDGAATQAVRLGFAHQKADILKALTEAAK
jgi:HK97 family phage portal protein